ncbi:MAG: hypothetical protein ACK4E7_02425 [Permianibacter sp.]
MMLKYPYAVAIAAVMVMLPLQAANPPAKAPERTAATDKADYVALGTSAFGPNGHGAYAWFVDVKNQQVVMCLVHNPQSDIECKRSPLPAVTAVPAMPPSP